jgi:hypothetical protein
MLKYYTFYSVGGYKEFFLGDLENKAEFTYYFPLLSILEEEAKNTESVTERVEKLKALPKIGQISESDTFGLPGSAQLMFTDKGYKLLYRHLEGDTYALAIRDISNNATDDVGKPTPFLFVILGEGNKDVQSLNVLAAYFANNLTKVQATIAGFIGMNQELNGLEFSNAQCNAWVNGILEEQKSKNVITTEGTITLKGSQGATPLLVLPEGWTEKEAVAEQELNGKNVNCVAEKDLVSKDDPKRLLEQMELMSDKINAGKKKLSRWKIFVIVAAVAALVLGILLARLF